MSESGGVGRGCQLCLPLWAVLSLLKPGQMNVSTSTVQTRLSRAGSEPGEFAAGMCESDHLGCRMLMGRGEAHRGPREEEEEMSQTVLTAPPPSTAFHYLLT